MIGRLHQFFLSLHYGRLTCMNWESGSERKTRMISIVCSELFMFAWMAQSMCESFPSVGHTTWRHAESVSMTWTLWKVIFSMMSFLPAVTIFGLYQGWKATSKTWYIANCLIGGPNMYLCRCSIIYSSCVTVSQRRILRVFAGICAGHCGLDYYVRFFLMIWYCGWKRLECCVSLCIRLHWHVHIILYMGRYVDGLHW